MNGSCKVQDTRNGRDQADRCRGSNSRITCLYEASSALGNYVITTDESLKRAFADKLSASRDRLDEYAAEAITPPWGASGVLQG